MGTSVLARKIQERHPQFNFVAGMLRQSLSVQLRWEVIRSGGTKSYQRTTTFRAPSWSWASVDAGVMISDSFAEKKIIPKILDAQIQEGGDLMGQNISASLIIEGHLMNFGIGCGTESTDLGGAEFCINGVWHQPRMENEKLYALRDADEPFRNLHCLVLGGRQTDYMTLIWLLIQPTGSKNGEFKRYGRYQFHGQTYNLSVRSDLKNVYNEEWLEYESVGEDGKHTVSIL